MNKSKVIMFNIGKTGWFQGAFESFGVKWNVLDTWALDGTMGADVNQRVDGVKVLGALRMVWKERLLFVRAKMGMSSVDSV